jgi:hypothetical protein
MSEFWCGYFIEMSDEEDSLLYFHAKVMNKGLNKG